MKLNFKEALVKNLLTSIALITLCSCGQNSSKVPFRLEQENSPFGLPKENFYRSVTMVSGESSYDEMSINPEQKKPVLGDEAFYVNTTFHSTNLYKIDFNFFTDVESISVIDANSPVISLLQIAKEQLSSIPKRELKNFSIELIWGKKNLDNQDYDMLNKAYVVKTSATDSVSGVDYKSVTTYLMWFECSSAIETLSELTYACGRNQLKFHYKVLDYQLTETKI